jgi:hypothetical protein
MLRLKSTMIMVVLLGAPQQEVKAAWPEIGDGESEGGRRYASAHWQAGLQRFQTTAKRFVQNFPVLEIIKSIHQFSRQMLPVLKRFPIAVSAELFGAYLRAKYIDDHTHFRAGAVQYFHPPARVRRWSQEYFDHTTGLFGLSTQELITHFSFEPFQHPESEHRDKDIQKAYGYLPYDLMRDLHQQEINKAINELGAHQRVDVDSMRLKVRQNSREQLGIIFEEGSRENLTDAVCDVWAELHFSAIETHQEMACKLTRFFLKIKDEDSIAPLQRAVALQAAGYYGLAHQKTRDLEAKRDFQASQERLMAWGQALSNKS